MCLRVANDLSTKTVFCINYFIYCGVTLDAAYSDGLAGTNQGAERWTVP